jgi:hypothetical protein
MVAHEHPSASSLTVVPLSQLYHSSVNGREIFPKSHSFVSFASSSPLSTTPPTLLLGR